MTAWIVLVLAGAGSLAFRFVPQLASTRVSLSPTHQAVLRDAGLAALVAMIVASVRGVAVAGVLPLAAVAAGLLAGTGLALKGRSLPVAVGAGLATAWTVTAALTLAP